MKKPIIAILLGSLLFVCTKENINIYDPEFKGNYSLNVNFPSSDTSTFEIFRTYQLSYLTGSDTFSGYSVSANITGLIDTAFFYDSSDASTFLLYFKKAGEGFIKITGHSPNESPHNVRSDSQFISIINPYQIKSDISSSSGNCYTMRIVHKSGLPISRFIISATWITSSQPQASNLPVDTFYSICNSGNQDTVCATVSDNKGHSSELFCHFVTAIPQPRIDSISINSRNWNIGTPLLIRLYASNIDTTTTSIFLRAARENSPADSSAFDMIAFDSIISWNPAITDTGKIAIDILLQTKGGQHSNIYKDTILAIAAPPAVSFVPDLDTFFVPLGVFSVTVSDNAEKYIWLFDGKDTLTYSPALSMHFFASADSPGTLIVCGIDKYGYRGLSDTIILVPRQYEYDITWVAVPPETTHIDSATWVVSSPQTELLLKNEGAYFWTLKNANNNLSILDTSGIALTDLHYKLPDSVRIVCTVQMKDKHGGTSAVISHSSFAAESRPVVELHADTLIAGTNQLVRFGYSAYDRNGRIVALWRSTNSEPKEGLTISDSVFSLAFSSVGSYEVVLTAMDNDSLVSHSRPVVINVKEALPVVTDVTVKPQIVYVSRPCSIYVAGIKGTTNSGIAQTYWDVSGNLMWDDSTRGLSPYYYASGFGTAGHHDIHVWISDSLGNLSTPFKHTLLVDPGKPMVNALHIAPKTIYINEMVKCSVSAYDNDGHIAGVNYSFDSGLSFYSTTSTSIDTVFAHPGKRYVMVFVTDNNGLKSDTLRDSIVIKAGSPVVDSIQVVSSGDLFVNEQFQVLVYAKDENSSGFISKYRLVARNEQTGDSITFESANQLVNLLFSSNQYGRYSLTCNVVDNDSFSSIAYKYKNIISISRGYPEITALLPETAWVNDTITYSVSARDSNGTIKALRIDWGDGTRDSATFNTDFANLIVI